MKNEKNELQKELEGLNYEYFLADRQVEQLLQAQKEWHTETRAYLCNTEAGRKAKLYYENAESKIWQSYERAIFKHRFKNHPEYYKVKYVLEMKEWFKKQKIEIPDQKELELSEERFSLEVKQWNKKLRMPFCKRDSLGRQVYGLKNKIQLFELEETFTLYETELEANIKRKSPNEPEKSGLGVGSVAILWPLVSFF